MGIGSSREENGTFQQSFQKEQSSLGLSWQIKGNLQALLCQSPIQFFFLLSQAHHFSPTSPKLYSSMCISCRNPLLPASLSLGSQAISVQPSLIFSTSFIFSLGFTCNWEFRFLLQLFSSSVFFCLYMPVCRNLLDSMRMILVCWSVSCMTAPPNCTKL